MPRCRAVSVRPVWPLPPAWVQGMGCPVAVSAGMLPTVLSFQLIPAPHLWSPSPSSGTAAVRCRGKEVGVTLVCSSPAPTSSCSWRGKNLRFFRASGQKHTPQGLQALATSSCYPAQAPITLFGLLGDPSQPWDRRDL